MKIIDGNKACSNIAYLFSEVCAIYPITPSSPMAENIDYMSGNGEKNLYNTTPKLVEMESEAGAAGALHGSLLSGSLSTTFTASQGLLLMIPNMYKIAGEMLPGVIHVASRSLATHALSIFGDHQDIYAVRGTGWCMLASTNVEDAQNLAAVAHLSSIKASLPFVHFFDGFRTSHEINTVPDIDNSKLLELIDEKALNKFRKRALNLNHEINYGTSQTEDVYFQCMEARNSSYNKVPDIVNGYMEKINVITGKNYKPFNYYGDDKAENIIIAMGSVCDTIKSVVEKEQKIGLIEVHLYRPFSTEFLKAVLPKSVKNIAVLDRTKEAGSIGEPLYLDVLGSLKDLNLNIVGGRYGLSSKNTTPAHIKAVFNMLESKPVHNFTIGINDDVTNLSLPEFDYDLENNTQEIKIYGYGSDGMVSASRDMLNLTHKNLGKYIQGYFEYDSKKSGGVTVSHLRIADNHIDMPYYIENPSFIVVTKDDYLNKYNIFDEAKDESYILINTIKNEKEFNEFLTDDVKEIILNKKLNINIINAEKIATANHIAGKINKIMEINILNLLGVKEAKELMIHSIKKNFAAKGEDIVNSNINALNEALNSINHIAVSLTGNKKITREETIYDKMLNRKGNTLSVKDVFPICNGSILWGLSKNEKRGVSDLTPKWNSEKCIECGMCALVCPHGVIRNFATKDKTKGKPFIGKDDYNFYVGISNKDCTGCSLCASICPSKSITMESGVKPTDELFKDYENPEILPKTTIKGVSLENPKFEFSGACAGCGETPYLKLLSQLFGNEIVIANATGCSSIYGASSPSTPYSLPWANSLFEDNAEFAYGIHISYKQKQNQIINAIKNSYEVVDADTKELYDKYMNNLSNYKITKEITDSLDDTKIPRELNSLKEYMPKRTVWAIGGDGWAYDIGYNGIDHILHSNENIKILVLDTEVYSNTGGQASKSTKIGAIAEFADFGKRTNKKDLFKIASGIDNVYVASISLGANMMQAIKAFNEAQNHEGPAIIIAYCPCISHGIKKGMSCSINEEKLAVECGYTILMRSESGKLSIDSQEPNFDKYQDFLNGEVRYNALKLKDENLANELLQMQIDNAKKRYEYYKKEVN